MGLSCGVDECKGAEVEREFSVFLMGFFLNPDLFQNTGFFQLIHMIWARIAALHDTHVE